MGTLTAMKVKALREAGRYPDGDGLYLLVKNTGARSWLLRAQVDGKRRDFGLGSAKDISLAEARDRAAATRKQYRGGIDPVAAKREKKVAVPTFAEAAERAHAEFKGSWRNAKHRAQWLSTLQTYAFPTLGNLPVDRIEASAIINALQPIWLTVPETADRVKQRIGAVLDWAYSHGFRQSEAPMRAIGKGLPARGKKDRHFAALPYDAVPDLIAKLSKAETTGRMALQFAILTAARSGEVRHATWGEINLDGSLWTIPATRMKAGREHVVPLSTAAIALLKRARGDREVDPTELVFSGNRGKPLSDMTMGKALKTAVTTPATVHGFRSSFRDWAAEQQTGVPDAVVEAALAHVNPNKVESAYRRTNFLEQRKRLMQAWSEYLLPSSTT